VFKQYIPTICPYYVLGAIHISHKIHIQYSTRGSRINIKCNSSHTCVIYSEEEILPEKRLATEKKSRPTIESCVRNRPLIHLRQDVVEWWSTGTANFSVSKKTSLAVNQPPWWPRRVHYILYIMYTIIRTEGTIPPWTEFFVLVLRTHVCRQWWFQEQKQRYSVWVFPHKFIRYNILVDTIYMYYIYDGSICTPLMICIDKYFRNNVDAHRDVL